MVQAARFLCAFPEAVCWHCRGSIVAAGCGRVGPPEGVGQLTHQVSLATCKRGHQVVELLQEEKGRKEEEP